MYKFKHFITVTFVIIFALSLRLINLDKSGGLWYDEATIYSIASAPSIPQMLSVDSHRFLHFPLYYLIYHLWISIWGNADITIRLMSVLFDMLSLCCAFLVGAQIGKMLSKDSFKTGLVYGLLYAVNSTFIYYAQEAKFYSLTFLFVNLILLFWFKYIETKSLKNLVILTLMNFLLIAIYSSQALFVILLYIMTIIILKKKNLDKKVVYVLPLSLLPIALLAICYHNYFSGNFTAVIYDNSFIWLALQNWFTPILNGLQNNVLDYWKVILTGLKLPQFWIYVIFPISFMLYLIINSLRKSIVTKAVFAIGVSYVLIHILLTIFTSYNVLVRYTIPVLPVFILLAAVGYDSNRLNKFLLSLFVVVNLAGILLNHGAPFINRPDGYRVLAQKLIEAEVPSNYNFVLPIRKDLLDKYYKITGEKLSLYTLKSPEAKQNFENFVDGNFIKNNHNIVVLTDKSICLFSNEDLNLIAQTNSSHKYPTQFLELSKLNNDLILVLSKRMNLKQTIVYKSWEIRVFEI